MKKWLFVWIILVIMAVGGCATTGGGGSSPTPFTDPNSIIQKTAELVLDGLGTFGPVEKILEKTPLGLPISAAFNGLLLVATTILEMRRRTASKSLNQVVIGVQAARQMMAHDAKALLDAANQQTQDPVTAGMVKAFKETETTKCKVSETLIALSGSGRWPAYSSSA
jgi:hypothetical protein